MLTANKARELSTRANFNRIDEQLRYVLEDIRECASDGKTEFSITKYSCKDIYDRNLWLVGARKNTNEWQKVEKTLKDLGFSLKYYFIRPEDEYIVISW